MTEDAFFDAPLRWSVYKHTILGKYLQVWVHKLSQHHRELAFVDTCAGAGRYKDGALGSPLLAAQWNAWLQEKQQSRLIVHACEPVHSTAEQLRESLAEYLRAKPPLAVVYERQYFDVMPQILRAVAGKPTLFFIDPYGALDITTEHIAPILARPVGVSTEVIARIDPGLLARFGGWLRKRERSPRQEKTAQGFRRLLERLDIDTAEISRSIESHGEDSIDAMMLLEAYLQQFRRRFRYIQIVPVRPSYFAAPKYFLIHGTDNAHGAAHINDVVSTTLDSLFASTIEAEDTKHGQVSLFPSAEQPRPRATLDFLEETACGILRSAGPMTFIKLRAELAMAYGPDFREKDHKAAVKRLISAGTIVRPMADTLVNGSLLTLRQDD